MTSSLVWPILAESLSNRGYSDTAISASAAVQFAGIVVVSLFATRFIPVFGILGSIGAGLVLVAIALIGLPILRDYTAWCALRFLLGIGNALLFTAGDTWINQILEDRIRGRWVGIYTTFGMAGWAVGPVVGASLDPETAWPFMIGLSSVIITSLLLLPTRRITFTFPTADRANAGIDRLMIVFLAAPTVLLASAMFGILEGGLQSFAHLYTMDVIGKEFRQTGYAVIWVGSVGAIFFQYPVGWLADRVHRGWLLVACVFAIASCLAALPWLIHGGAEPWWRGPGLMLWSIVVVWGGRHGRRLHCRHHPARTTLPFCRPCRRQCRVLASLRRRRNGRAVDGGPVHGRVRAPRLRWIPPRRRHPLRLLRRHPPAHAPLTANTWQMPCPVSSRPTSFMTFSWLSQRPGTVVFARRCWLRVSGAAESGQRLQSHHRPRRQSRPN